MQRFGAAPSGSALVTLWFLAALPAGAQDDLAERVRRLEQALEAERALNAAQSARIKELEHTLVVVSDAQEDAVRTSELEREVGTLVDDLVGRRLDGWTPPPAESPFAIRGQGRFVIRAFGNETITTDESFEIEHLLVLMSLDLGEGFTLRATPAVSHQGGLAIITASADWRPAPWIELRAGRFLVPVNGIHAWAFPSDSFIEPYLVENAPRPFLYAPWWDEGLMARGAVGFGEDGRHTFRYAAYVLNGFDANGLDGFHKRNIGDNNRNKTLGARAAADFDLGDALRLSVGASFLYGKYDADDDLAFVYVEADVELAWGPFLVYAEVFHRPTEIRGGVVENPDATVQDVARLTGIKVRPRFRITDAFSVYIQWDWLQLRQPPLASGRFSVLALDDEATTIVTYVLGFEYAVTANLVLFTEGGVFERDHDIGPDIPFISAGIYASF